MTPATRPATAPTPPPRTGEEVVLVTGLTKAYGGRTVLAGLDLSVTAGEVVGLIGANGAGKTTTVECLQGLRRPDAGRIRVLGLDPITDADRLRPMIGSQLQDSGLPDRLRVHEALWLFTGPGARAGEGEALLERFGLGHRRTLAFGTMSGGERQRLFLVLALLNRPRLVILDELTQGLDPVARREVWAAVAQLREGGTTVLLVTHELEEAEVLCDRVVVMRAGRVLDSGTPAELVARHAGWARIRFGLPPDGSGWDAPDLGDLGDLGDLRGLPGVHHVERRGDRVEVTGRRSTIAHVGAWLVRRGPVPEDLSVDVPDLEEALLSLLDAPEPEQETSR